MASVRVTQTYVEYLRTMDNDPPKVRVTQVYVEALKSMQDVPIKTTGRRQVIVN